MGKKKGESTGTVTRGPKTTINLEALRDLIKAGANAKEIMAEIGIKQVQSLRNSVFKLSQLDRIFYDVPGLINDARRPGAIRVGKTGLKLPLKSIPYEVGTVVIVSVDGHTIAINPVGGTVSPVDEATVV